MTRLSSLKGLGPKSEKELNAIGIFTKEDLENTGPVNAYIKLKKETGGNVSLNFLYAMVGAIENRHWTDIAKAEKERLLFELEGYAELEKIINEQ